MRYVLISKLSLAIVAVCLVTISMSISYAFAGDSLDGKSFTVQVTEMNKTEATKDELIFKDGTFFSTDCEQYGFGPASYESKAKGDAVLFESTLMSDKEGKAEWEGSVKGEKISGTFIWSKEGQDPIIYTYEGSMKK